MKPKTIIFDTTEAIDPERRGIGVQMRSWLEAAPFAAYPRLQFILAGKAMPRHEPLGLHAANVREVVRAAAATETAFIDYLYGLGGDLLFFPLASQKYVREGAAKIVGVDYGMEDVYCRDYIAPQPVTDMLEWHGYALRRYTSIITVSKTSQRDLAWFFPGYKGKVHVVYPGSTAPADVSGQVLPAALQGSSYFLVIGYEHKKNIIRIADGFDAFKRKSGSRTKLAIAGNPGFGAAEIDNHIQGLACAEEIVRLGYVPVAQKQFLVQHCHALVALPIYEGFGISALEGLEAGRVVLVSNNGSLREIVGNAGYSADPFSVAAIEKGLALVDRLADNPKKQRIPDRLAVFDRTVQAGRLLRHLSKIVAQ